MQEDLSVRPFKRERLAPGFAGGRRGGLGAVRGDVPLQVDVVVQVARELRA